MKAETKEKPKKDTADQTIKAKWGDRLLKVSKSRRQGGLGGYIPVVRSFLRLYSKLGLSPQAAMAALHILDSKWDKNEPWTSAAILAGRMKKSESHVKKYIADLRDLGVRAEYNAKKRLYKFNFDKFFETLAATAEHDIAEFVKKQEEAAADAY